MTGLRVGSEEQIYNCPWMTSETGGRDACRSMKDDQGREYGVAGTVEELAQATLSSQPLSAFNWCPERAGLFCCGALDMTLRVGLVTGLPA